MSMRMNSASVQRVTSDTVEASVAGKLTAESGTKSAQLPGKPNELFFGDNLDILRRYVKDESVDLIYLDPPFNSGRDYNVLFEEKDGSKAAAQIRAFTDTWEWNSASALAFEETVALGGKVADALLAFRAFLGESDMLAYLSMMAPRLVELRRVLKEDGSLFLHCDPTSSHYLKMLLDAVFDPGCLRNEIDWCYTGPGSPGIRQYLRKHDVIFWYSKGNTWAFNADAVRVPHSMKTKANYKEGLIGSGFVGAEHVINPDGKVPEDWWQIAIAARGREYLGYPTQKPLALLERIIAASSDPGDVVLDPFCGCGTAVDAAQSLGRRWIGIDITHLAIGLIRSRLVDRYGADVLKSVRVVGEPTTIEDAEELAKNDPYQFQCWALGLVGARPAELKKGADRGIDGRLYFNDTGVAGAKAKQIIFSVKAGHVTSSFVRDLRGVLEREGAQIGVLLSFEEPTKPMRHEALSAGFYSSPLGQHQRIQLLTVKQLLSEHQVDYPWRAQASNVTYKHTVPAHSAVAEQPSLV